MDRRPLLTDDELEKLALMVDAMRAIAASNIPGLPDTLSDEIDRLREMVRNEDDRTQILELADDLNAGTEILDWADALHEGDCVIEKLVLKLSDEKMVDVEDNEERSESSF
jgi:hypothetical protein